MYSLEVLTIRFRVYRQKGRVKRVCLALRSTQAFTIPYTRLHSEITLQYLGGEKAHKRV